MVNASCWEILMPLMSTSWRVHVPSISNKLLTAADEEFLQHAVTSPTRCRKGHLPFTLDLVLSRHGRSFLFIASHHWVKATMPPCRWLYAVSELSAGNLSKPKRRYHNIWRSSNTGAAHRPILSRCAAKNQISFRNWWKRSRGKSEIQLALKTKSRPKLFFAHVRRNRHFKW